VAVRIFGGAEFEITGLGGWRRGDDGCERRGLERKKICKERKSRGKK
jgi:hypothetical protein